MKNTARKFQNEESIKTIKDNLDVSTLNNFLITTPDKAIALIHYWEGKKHNATVTQKELLNIKIAKAEAIMERMLDLSLDIYDVDTVAWVDTNGFVPDQNVTDVLIDVAANADESKTKESEESSTEDAPILSIFTGDKEEKTPKLSDLANAVKALIRKGHFDSAKLMASQYLTVGNYVPKKEKQKPDKWSDAKIDSWIKDINNSLSEEKQPRKTEEPLIESSDAAAKGLTSGEVEKLRLLNIVIPDSIAGHQDYQSRRETLQRYLNMGEDLDTEEEMLKGVAKRIYDSQNGNKLPEVELAKLCKDINDLCTIFFAHRRYDEASVKEWHTAARKNLDLKHFKYLKAKEGVVLFPSKEKADTGSGKENKKEEVLANDKIPMSEIKTLLETIIENGGKFEDIKTHPEILKLVNKEILVHTNVPAMKFGKEEVLFSWLEVHFKEIQEKVNIKPATDAEIIEKATEVSKEKVNDTTDAEKFASLDNFMLLIETAAKNDVSIEDFIKEHESLIKDSKGQYKKLVSEPKNNNTTSSVILAGRKDLETWVTEVYKRFAKSETPIDTKEENKDINLVSSFKELVSKGKETLKKGISYDAFMVWLTNNLLNRKMKEQKAEKVFKTPEAIEIFAKNTFKEDLPAKTETTVVATEEVKYTVEDIKSAIVEDSKQKDASFPNLARDMRTLYLKSDIQINGKVPSVQDIMSTLEEWIKDSNPEMYNARQERKNKKKEEPEQQKLPLEETKVEETKTESTTEKTSEVVTETVENTDTVDAEHEIFEKVDVKSTHPDIWKIVEGFKTLDEVYNMAIEFHTGDNFNAALSMCLEIMPKIEASKNWTPEQIIDWYNKNILKAKTTETKEETKDVTASNDLLKEECFEELQNSTNKKSFKQAIADVLKKHEDNKEIRDAIINAIKTGNGSHTRQVGKMPDSEMHKMINNIKEKVGKFVNKD